MDINAFKIHIISPEKLTDYMRYINPGEFSLIQEGKAAVFGIDNAAGEPVGAAAIEMAPEPDNGPGHVLVIKELSLMEDYLNRDVFQELVDRVSEEAVRKNCKGIVMQNAHPDNPQYESYLEDNCFRLDDGNSIYEADVDYMYDHPIFKKTISGLAGNIKRFSDLGKYERTVILSEWDDHFPKGLSPGRLPGKWLPDFSYVYQKDSEFRGFILASELSQDKLYVGGVYTNSGEPLAAAAFISTLGRAVILDSDYRKVMFAGATDEGNNLCEKLLKGIHSIKKWKIHNYYLEV